MSRADWIFAKREEARRLHLASYRAWLEAGAFPLPIHAAVRN
jgi:hypothetical protein